MFESLNQGISTTKGILVVVLVAAIAGGGILAYQYLWQPEPEPIPPVQPPSSAPSITVLSPNGGETWAVGNTYDIIWEKSGVEKVKVVLYKNDKFFDSIVVSSIDKVSYTVSRKDTTELPGDKYKVRICKFIELGNADCDAKAGETLIMDESDNYFSIVSEGTPYIQVLSPNGGEILATGNTYNIRWNSQGLDKVTIELLKFDSDKNVIDDYITGAYGDLIAQDIGNKRYYEWTIPDSVIDPILGGVTEPYYFKIMVYNFESGLPLADSSDNYFNIIVGPKPSITLLSPNSEETWVKGGTYEVQWESEGIENVNILLVDYRAPESCYLTPSEIIYIETKEEGVSGWEYKTFPVKAEEGKFSVQLSTVTCYSGMGHQETVEISSGDQYKIKIEDADNPSISDFSDNYFTIVE